MYREALLSPLVNTRYSHLCSENNIVAHPYIVEKMLVHETKPRPFSETCSVMSRRHYRIPGMCFRLFYDGSKTGDVSHTQQAYPYETLKTKDVHEPSFSLSMLPTSTHLNGLAAGVRLQQSNLEPDF